LVVAVHSPYDGGGYWGYLLVEEDVHIEINSKDPVVAVDPHWIAEGVIPCGYDCIMELWAACTEVD